MPRRASATRARPRPPWQRSLASALALLIAAPPAVLAAPQGGQEIAGNTTIVQTQDGSRTIIRASDGAILEWQDFDIAENEVVRFVQPGAWARVLNRVVTPDPTQIDGRLIANGIVYVVNPYGIYVGDKAIIDTAQFIAASGEISNADFLAGIDRFTELGGRIENLGTIRADSVTLIGRYVANHGTIHAPDGAIWMVAGDEVIIAEHDSPVVVRLSIPQSGPGADEYAVVNTGTLDAGRGEVRLAAGDLLSLAIYTQGEIHAHQIALDAGQGGAVRVEGVLDATGLTGGAISVDGDYIAIDDALLDASGTIGGGSIRVGGGPNGASARANAKRVYIGKDAKLRADAVKKGDGGEVVVFADDAAYVYGELSAHGGARFGDGGFVETSGRRYLAVDGVPDVGAPAPAGRGKGGEWLIDPSDLRVVDEVDLTVGPTDERNLTDIVDALADSGVSGSSILPEADSSEVSTESIERALARGIDVTLSTLNIDGDDTQEGNIQVVGNIDFANLGEQVAPETLATLAFRAANNLTIDGTISDATESNLTLSTDFDAADPLQQSDLVPETRPDDPVSLLNGSIQTNAPIDIKGNASFLGTSVLLHDDLKADGGVFITAALGTVETEAITTDGQGVTISAAAAEFDDPDDGLDTLVLFGGDVTVNGAVDTQGGDFALASTGGDIVTTATAPIDTQGTDAAGNAVSGAVLMTAARARTTDGLETRGGSVTTEAAITAGGTGVELGGDDTVTVRGTVRTDGSRVLLGIRPNSVFADAVVLEGAVTTEGGDFLSGGAVTDRTGTPVDSALGTFSTTANIDVRGAAFGNDDGDITIGHPGDVTIGDGVTLSGASVSVQSGIDGTGDLRFVSNDAIEANEITLVAGNGFTAAIDESPGGAAAEEGEERNLNGLQMQAAIDFGGLASLDPLNPGGETEFVRVQQDASFDVADMPQIASLADGSPTPVGNDPLELRIGAADGTLTMGDVSKVNGQAGDLVDLTLEAADGVAIGMGDVITTDTLAVRVSRDFSVDEDFADSVSGSRELRIEAGTGSRLAGDGVAAVPGDLTIATDAVLAASDDLVLHGGSGGVGDLVLGDDVTLRSNRVELRAGDGVGGSNGAVLDEDGSTPASSVTFGSGLVLEDPDLGDGFAFVTRQDADLDNAATPRVDPVVVPSEVTVELRSDDGAVKVSDADASDLDGTHLVIAAQTIDFSDLSAGALDVLSADLGGIGDFTVGQSTVDTVAPTSTSLTLRAGVASDGTLDFAPGTTLRSDRIRLIASDGPGGNIGSSIDFANVRFEQTGNPNEAPTTFLFEQDFDIVGSNPAPAADAFGDGTGTTANSVPDTYALRSTDGRVQLESASVLPSEAVRIIAAPTLQLIREDGTNLVFDPNTELRGNAIELEATDSTGTTTTASIDPTGALFGGFDDEEEDLDLAFTAGQPATRPESLSIRQDATITDANLPDAAALGANAFFDPDVTAMRYTLTSERASIELGALNDMGNMTRVADTALVLRLGNPEDDVATRTIDLNAPDTMLSYDLESLDLRIGHGLQVDADTNVTANDSILIAAGENGEGGDLVFGASTLSAKRVLLRAGEDENIEVADADRSSIDATALSVVLDDSDEDSILELTSDADLVNGLPASVAVVGGTRAEAVLLQSRRGRVTADDVAQLTFARNLQMISGGFVTEEDSQAEFAVTLGAASNADLDLTQNPMSADPFLFEDVFLSGESVELQSRGSGRIFADTETLTITGPAISGVPDRFTIHQESGALDTSLGAGQLAPLDRFSGSTAGMEYELIVDDDDFSVDDVLAEQLAGTDLRLETANGSITVSSDTGSDPRFFGLSAQAPDITMATPEFETTADQLYQGQVTFAQSSRLVGRDLVFEGDVMATNDASEMLTLRTSGSSRFEGDVGTATERFAGLDLDFEPGGTLEFAGATTNTVNLSGDLLVRSIDSDGDAVDRRPVPDAGTIFKSEPGDVHIRAANVLLGRGDDGFPIDGQKWSVAGTLDIDAPGGEVEVGDVAALGIEIEADRLTIVRRPAGDVLRPGGTSDRDAGVDLVANQYLLNLANGVQVVGGGRDPVIGIPDGVAVPSELARFTSAEINVDGSLLEASDFVFDDPDDDARAIGLDQRPRGSARSDFSSVLTEPVPAPKSGVPLGEHAFEEDAFSAVGIQARAATGSESSGLVRGAAIYDDASHTFVRAGGPVRMASARVEADAAEEAVRLYREVFGPGLENTPAIREILAKAVSDYREATGARRVLGFELRRYLKNRPSSQFEAYQLLEDLDHLFSAHRRAGLVPGEYRPVQRRWVEAIAPEGIGADELAEAIHPSRYVRGSDVLDIFGD